MSKGLRNMTKHEQDMAIKRRLATVPRDKNKKPFGGLGYWAAVDAKAKKGKNK